MVVEEGKIREFAEATKSLHPAYLTEPEPVSPPTFLTTACFWQREWEQDLQATFSSLGVDPSAVLHGEEEYVFRGEPPRAGATLHGRTKVVNLERKVGRRAGPILIVKTSTKFRDSGGRVVAESRSTMICPISSAETSDA
jgi:hypothetical protein